MSLERSNATIVAVSTPHGGAIAVVRLSGDRALGIVQALSRRTSFLPRHATLCHIYDGHALLDEVVVIFFQAPHSYTCEDVCEIQCHGGSVITRRLVELILEHGAELAKNGEFTKRAFLAGRIDLSQAQAIGKMIEAKSLRAQKALARQLKGELSEFVAHVRDELYEALAHSEVMIDYSDEDLPPDLLLKLEERINQIVVRLEQILSYSSLREGVFSGFSLSIIGKPNVGKSSLLNALLMQDRAIVSDMAGTTRDTIEAELNLFGVQVSLIDTAGIRKASDEIERIGIAKSKESIRHSHLILAVFDQSREWESEDSEILEILQSQTDKHILVVFNKSDLPLRLDAQRLQSYQSIALSAKEKEIDALLQVLSEILSPEESDVILLSEAHQRQSFQRAIASLNLAKLELSRGVLELFSYNIKDAISLIGSITQPYQTAELLDKMFSEFCLGK